MRNLILAGLGALMVAGCAHEKPFDVTGVVSPSQMSEGSESVATTQATQPSEPQYTSSPRTSTRPQPNFPSPQRNAAPPQSRPTPSTAGVETEPSAPVVAPPVQQAAPPRPAPAPAPAPKTQTQPPKVTITPESGLQGKVVSVNSNLRFVVLNFPVGRMAAVDQQFSVYRSGQKIGEVKITGPQQDDNIIADISTGDVQQGDEVRQN